MTSEISQIYKRIFGLDEYRASEPLKILFYVILLGFFLGFFHYSYDAYGATGQGMCWPYLQACEQLKFFSAYPNGYLIMAIYSLAYGLIILSAVLAYRKSWLFAHLTVTLLFFWKFFVAFILSNDSPQPFEIYHLSLCAIWLFARNKEYFGRRLLVILYFLSAALKFRDSWVTGSFFTSLELGMPFVSNRLVPVFTNFIIFIETVGVWLLLSPNKLVQRSILAIFTAFHLYSIIMIGYNFPTYSLLPLLALFLPSSTDLAKDSDPPFKTFFVGGAVLAFVCVMHAIPYLSSRGIPYSQERYLYGLDMFISNHQCR
jgi:hypothetical protein